MEGFFIVALAIAVISALFLAGFLCTAALIAITKGADAARQFIKDEF